MRIFYGSLFSFRQFSTPPFERIPRQRNRLKNKGDMTKILGTKSHRYFNFQTFFKLSELI